MEDDEFLSQLEETLRSAGLGYLVDQERLAGEEGKASFKDGSDNSRHVEFEPLSVRERIAVLLDLLEVAIRGRHDVCLKIHELSQLGDSNDYMEVAFVMPAEIEGRLADDPWRESDRKFETSENDAGYNMDERLPSLVDLYTFNDDVEMLSSLINSARQMYDIEPSRDLAYAGNEHRLSGGEWQS